MDEKKQKSRSLDGDFTLRDRSANHLTPCFTGFYFSDAMVCICYTYSYFMHLKNRHYKRWEAITG